MIKNYFKIAWRNLINNRGYSAINIGGLAVGMAVAIIIGLWIWDELSFNKYHKNYDRIAVVMQHQTFNGEIRTQKSMPLPIGEELRLAYKTDFENVIMSWWLMDHTLTFDNKNYTRAGKFMENAVIDMFSLRMKKGTNASLKEPNSIILSESTARALFGNRESLNKIIKIDNNMSVKVTGIYEDFPDNSEFNEVKFIAPWSLFLSVNDWTKNSIGSWGNNAFECYVQLADNSNFNSVSAKIKNIKRDKLKDKEQLAHKPEAILQPMKNWHLFAEFKDGKNVGGHIQFVWLFGVIGVFVLLLACFNFMNLSTARSTKRAKEVGVRKAIGSERGQLIFQFFSESILISSLAFILSILLASLLIPFFNQVARKNLYLFWASPFFWMIGIVFSLFTGFVAGSYPAFYLSSFKAIEVLKGTFKMGRFASLPRKTLVVTQFTVSVTLIIGTVVVFQQIQFAKNRPLGYNQNGLISLQINMPDFHQHYNAARLDLLNSGAITEVSEASCPPTEVYESQSGFDWKGKDPGTQGDLNIIGISPGYGNTIGWKIKEGRDFNTSLLSDKSGLILNETAVKFMGLQNPVGQIIKWNETDYTVLAVIKDIIMGSPYEPAKSIVYYHLATNPGSFIYMKLNPTISVSESVRRIESIFKKYVPVMPFDYKFADEEYALKFDDEERIGKLAGIFAILAIFISSLGLFGLASFVAEQRTKEIGVRKVLGASVANLWAMLSKDFVTLVTISCIIAVPIAYYLMHGWLQTYDYRTEISWWVFAAAGAGGVVITLCTVSFQAIKAAVANPVKSLRTE